MNLKYWILAARPKTLTAALVPILVGTALAVSLHETIQVYLSLFAFFSALFIQIGTNLLNDAIDFKKGADTEERIGPQRVTQSGVFGFRNVLGAGLFCFLLASLLAIPLLLAGGLPILLIGVFSLLAGYAYTGGPFPLAYLGFGDVFVLIFFGWVAVSGVYYLQSGTVDWSAGVAGAQVGLLATVMIAINNFRDHLTDVKANKRTLAVRFGATFMRFEICCLCFLPFILGFFWFSQGLLWAFVLPLIMLPWAFRLTVRILKTEPGQIYNQFLARGAFLHLGFGGLLALGLWLK